MQIFLRPTETQHEDLVVYHVLCRLRFDVGSGMAAIRDPNPIKLGEFHTVELYRNHTLGYIIVDGGEPINGSSQVSANAAATCVHLKLAVNMFSQMHVSCPQGKFQGLDLNEELHVGGYPNYTVLTKTAGIKTGFVGKTSLC